MTLCAVTLDCADPASLARFYERATGLVPADGSGEDFAGLRGPDGFFLGFQRMPDYRAPAWPGQEQPQQSQPDRDVRVPQRHGAHLPEQINDDRVWLETVEGADRLRTDLANVR